jgi:hypothetical protein
MKRTSALTLLLLVFWTAYAFAAPQAPSTGNQAPPGSENKGTTVPPPKPGGTLVGGEDVAHALPIPGIPYNDTGNTCGFRDDYQPPCIPDAGGKDVVYSFRPTTNVCIDISLCGSSYDTVLYVYRDDGIFGLTPIACNDDLCGLGVPGAQGQQSRIHNVQVLAGSVYYIVVDGFSSPDCGNYTLSITTCGPPCTVPCPAGAIQEGEPTCSDGYIDNTNGGCNYTPARFTNITNTNGTTTICGTYGDYIFQGSFFRDVDWYQIVLTAHTSLHVCATGEALTQLNIVDATGAVCGNNTPFVCGFRTGECETANCCDAELNPGTYWIILTTNEFVGVPCGSHYVMSVTSTPIVNAVCTVRTDANGDCVLDNFTQVTVQGVVEAWKEFGGSGPGAIEDPQSGCCISVFGIFNTPNIPVGSMVQVTGLATDFFGLAEVSSNPVVTVLSAGNPTPVTPVSAADLADHSSTAEHLESCLVSICGRFSDTGNFLGNTNYTLTDHNNNTCAVRIDVDTDIDGSPIPTGDVKITGILQQFDRTASGGTVRVPCTGYQLLPRSLPDLVTAGVNCATVAVQRSTWGQVKNLFR